MTAPDASRSPAPPPVSPELRAELAACAAAFLESLTEEEREAANLPLGSPLLTDWHYFPRTDQPGLLLARMDDAQRAAAQRLLGAGLSTRGHARAQAIMELEHIVRGLEGSDLYDPAHYALAIFGRPSTSEPWGWRIDGHHLSVTMVATPDGDVTVTPHFMGANPAVVHEGEQAGRKALKEEMDRAFTLIRALPDDLRARAIIAAETAGDVLTGPGREDRLSGPPEGLAFRDLPEPHQDHAVHLIRAYAERLRPELAGREMSRLRQGGLDGLHFAWMGATEPGRPHYYRLHGPTLVIEYDCTQDDANHVHTVWHDPGRDFGLDPLSRHYAKGHHGG